jgi:hypothetical protein
MMLKASANGIPKANAESKTPRVSGLNFDSDDRSNSE